MRSKKKLNFFEILTSRPTHGYNDILPDRNMWQEVAESVGGEFKVVFTRNHDIEIHRLQVPHDRWNIEINISDSRPLKIKASFNISQELEMIISWEDFIERFFKRFRKPEMELGWKDFDRHYLIKTNRSDLVRKIIASDIQKAFLKHNIYSFIYTTNLETRTAELVSVISRKAGDKDRNIELISLFKQIINKLRMARVIL